MQVAEKADEAAILMAVHQHVVVVGLGERPRRRHGIARLVQRLEILAVELDAAVFARDHRIGMRSGGRQHCFRRQKHIRSVRLFTAQADGVTVAVHRDASGRQPLREAHAFLHRLGDFLMVQRVGWAFDHLAAIGDGRPAPGIEQRGEAGRAAFGGGGLALGLQRFCVLQVLACDLSLFIRPGRAHRSFAALGGECAITDGEFLDLPHIIGETFGGGVDGGQSAADHDDRHADLQIGDGRHFRRACELQSHQEVARLTHAAREVVRHVDNGRPPRAHAQRDMVEPHRPGIVHGDRGAAAEAHAAERRELRTPLQEQADDLEVVLVPADGDAVFGDAAEARHHAVVEVFIKLIHIAHRRRRVDAERLQLQAVDDNHRVAVVHEVMGECEPRRPLANDEHLAPGVGRGSGRRMSSGFQRVSSE